MEIYITTFDEVYFNTSTQSMNGCENLDFLRYLKGVYTNFERFENRYINVLTEKLKDLKKECPEDHKIMIDFLKYLKNNYEHINPFSFKEAFEIKDKEFQALVFASINIGEMIESLGAKRYKTDGIELTHEEYNSDGKYIGNKTYHNIYEVWEIKGDDLGLKGEKLYTVKCWCTSTNKEHWLWIKEEFKDDPLQAIASTFMVHENVISKIDCLKRHGDILLVELKEDVVPEGELISLTKDQYFSLLKAQS